jgi:hypothetical protein
MHLFRNGMYFEIVIVKNRFYNHFLDEQRIYCLTFKF